MSCQAEQGVNIPEAVHVLRLNDGRVVVSAANGPGLSISQARTINQCKRAKLLSESVSISSRIEPTPVAQLYSEPVATFKPHTTFNIETGVSIRFACVRGGGVLQGGTAICPGY